MKLPTQRYAQDLRRYYRLPIVQVSLTLVLSLFVMAIFIVFALRPTILSIVTLKKTINTSEETLKKLNAKVIDLQKASSQLETLKPFLPIINKNIPNNGAMYSPLTTAVEILAIQAGVKLESETLGSTLLFSRILSPFTPNKSQSVVSMPFTVRIIGTYPATSMFLTNLLTMERIVGIESITITKETATKTAAATVSLNISGHAYYLADEGQLQKATADQKGKK